MNPKHIYLVGMVYFVEFCVLLIHTCIQVVAVISSSTRGIGFDSRTLAFTKGAECFAPLFARNTLPGIHVCGANRQRFSAMGVHVVRLSFDNGWRLIESTSDKFYFFISVQNRCGLRRMCLS